MLVVYAADSATAQAMAFLGGWDTGQVQPRPHGAGPYA